MSEHLKEIQENANREIAKKRVATWSVNWGPNVRTNDNGGPMSDIQTMSATERDWKPDDTCSICGEGIPVVWDWVWYENKPAHHDCILIQRAERAEAQNGRLLSDITGYVAIGQGLQERLEQAESQLGAESDIQYAQRMQIEKLEAQLAERTAERDALAQSVTGLAGQNWELRVNLAIHVTGATNGWRGDKTRDTAIQEALAALSLPLPAAAERVRKLEEFVSAVSELLDFLPTQRDTSVWLPAGRIRELRELYAALDGGKEQGNAEG